MPHVGLMRRVLHLLLPVIGLAICSLPAHAQVLPGVPQASPGAQSGARQTALFHTAPVTVDGAPVFRIAALASPPPGAIPIDTRALLVQNAIAQILSVDPETGKTEYDPKSFKVTANREGSQYVLFANDAKHATPVPILTITSDDARQNAQSDSALATLWQGQLQTALLTALEKRQPEVIKKNAVDTFRLAIALLVLTAVAVAILAVLRRRSRALTKTIDERRAEAELALAKESNEPAKPERQQQVVTFALSSLEPEQRLRNARTLASLVVWILLLAWGAAIVYALLLFPVTTAFGHYVIGIASSVAFIWLLAGISDRLLQLVIARFAEAYARRGLSNEDRARYLLRAPTISQALGGAKTLFVLFVAVLASLSVLDIPIASVVTIGGIAAVAVGFASQSLVKDFTGGLLVLFEDQYVVGDSIMIGDFNGIVENLTLRVVQLRDSKGRLITIPHGTVTQVVNNSRSWSRVDYRVAVAPGTDPDAAMQVMRDTFEALRTDDAWRDAVIEPVEWIGIEAIWQQGLVLRASMKTAPLRQFELQRVLNRRIYESFTKAGIRFGLDPDAAATLSVTASPDPL